MRRAVFWLVVAGLAFPALLLTLSRITDTDNGSLIRIESFTPLGLPLYFLLLVLLAFGAARRPRQHKVRLTGALLALAGLGLHAWWFSPQVLGEVPAAADGAPRITVMNANLFEGRADAGDLMDAVTEHHVDVLVLEEITPGLLDQLDSLGLDEVLPYRVGEPDYMVAGTMILANEPLTDPVRVGTTFQSWQATYAGMLTVLGVHPVAPVDPAGWGEDHRVILAQATESDADLVVGDMNATPDHDVMRNLDAAGFRDAGELANVGWQPTWPANHVSILPLLPPLVRIDHVLVGRALTSLGTETVDIDGTDHLAVIATVARRA